MGKHRVDLAGIRRQVGLRHDVVAVVAGDVLEQLLEIVAVAVDRGAEFGVALILAADLVEGLLALQRVEAAREDVAFAAPVAVPQFDRGLVVDGAGDVDRKRVQRFDDMQRRALRRRGVRAGGCSAGASAPPRRARRRAAGRAPSRPAATGALPARAGLASAGRSRSIVPRKAWSRRRARAVPQRTAAVRAGAAARARARPARARRGRRRDGWKRDRKRRTCGPIWRRCRTVPSAH